MESRDETRAPIGSGRAEGGGGMDDARQGVRRAAEQAREAGGRLAGRARDEASRLVESRKDKAAHSLDSLSGVLRDGAGRLSDEESFFGGYAATAAERVEQLARYLRESDPERLVRDAEGFARRRPEVFVGGMFVAGMLLARFLKSSSSREDVESVAVQRGGRRGPDASFQPESGAYAGSPGAGVSGVGAAGAGTYNPADRRPGGVEIAPDDESGLGV